MSAALPRPERADTAVPAALPEAEAAAAVVPAAAPSSHPPTARLADEQAIPAPSPVHRMQAELAQLTQPQEQPVEAVYPGWFRIGFPLASSVLLWMAILWGVSRLA